MENTSKYLRLIVDSTGIFLYETTAVVCSRLSNVLGYFLSFKATSWYGLQMLRSRCYEWVCVTAHLHSAITT